MCSENPGIVLLACETDRLGLMRVVVTGSKGMLGANLVKSFRDINSSVELLVIDRSDLDLLSEHDTLAFMQSSHADVVVHAAAVVGGGPWKQDNQLKLLHENIRLDMNVMMASFKAKVPNLAYISSSTVYPATANKPIPERALFSGALEESNENYGLGKIVGMKLCAEISKIEGYSYKSLVLPNLYGLFDRFDPLRSHLVPSVILKIEKALRSSAETVEIFGNESDQRELLFVSDFTDWLVRNIKEIPLFPTHMNMGSGEAVKVRTIYEQVAKMLGFQGNFCTSPHAPSRVSRRVLDSSVAEGYGWEARTRLGDGLKAVFKEYASR